MKTTRQTVEITTHKDRISVRVEGHIVVFEVLAGPEERRALATLLWSRLTAPDDAGY